MSRPVIVYDGECRLCRQSAEWLRKLDLLAQFEYLPYRAAEVEARFPQLAHFDLDAGLRLVDHGERVHVGADAVYEICLRMAPFRVLAWVYREPAVRRLVQALYSRVARNRHRLG